MLKEDIKEGWLDEDPRIVAAALLGIFTFIFLNVLLHKSEKHKNRIKKECIENKTAIEGKLIKHGRSHDPNSKITYYGTYEYTINGKIEQYRIRNINIQPPNTIKLYPKNDSMTKFFSDYDKTSNAAIAFNGLAAIAVCVFTLLFTNYLSP